MNKINCLLAALSATFAVLAADTLEVLLGSPMTISDDTYGNNTHVVEAHDVLTISSGATFKPYNDATATNWFGTVSGDKAALRIVNTGSSSANAPTVTFGAKTRLWFDGGLTEPAIFLSGTFYDRCYLYNVRLTADASVTVEGDDSTDEILFARIGGGSESSAITARIATYSFATYNAKPAVIEFNGGALRFLSPLSNSGLLVSDPSAKFILRGTNGHDIVLTSYTGRTYNFPAIDNEGPVETDGDCNFVWRPSGANETNIVQLTAAYGDSTKIAWGHTGETCFTNVRVVVSAENALPYSATRAMTLRFGRFNNTTADDPSYLDLDGNSAKVGNLYLGSDSYVTNSSATAAMLVFGADNLDSTFSGTIAGDVTLVKKGTGTLTIADGSVVPKIKLDGAELSSVVIDGSATIGEWDVSIAPKKEGETTYAIASGETYDVAPFGIEPAWFWDVSWTNLYRFNYKSKGTPRSSMQDVLEATTSNGLHRVSVESGGTAAIDVAEGATEKYEYLALTGSGTLEKTGSGTATILGDNRVALGTLHVAGGTLKFQGRGCTNEWWRVVMKKNGKDTILATGRIGIFDANGDMAVSGLDWKEYNKDISTLALREWTDVLVTNGVTSVEDPWKYANSYDRKYLFDIDKDNRGKMGLQYSKTSKTDEATITFRANLTESPAIWHSLSTAGAKGHCPYQWSLETSPDGETWNAINEISSEDWIFSNYTWRNDGRYSDKSEGMPWRIGLDNAPAAVSALGTVQVDSGATLDLSMTTNAVISSIAIDVQSAGGTISGGSLASAGAVSVVSTSDKLPKTVLLTFDGTANATALRNWTVTFNGSVVPRRLVCDSETGEVHFSPSGFILMVK